MSWIDWIKDYWMSAEELEKCERRVPAFSILSKLSDEQFLQVDEKWYIKASLLNPELLREVEEALAFDYALSQTAAAVSWDIHRCL